MQTEEANPKITTKGREIPKIIFSNTYVKGLIQRWEQSLIISTGQTFRDLEALKRRLYSLRRIKSTMEIKDLGFNFYLIHRLLEEERTIIVAAKKLEAWRTPNTI